MEDRFIEFVETGRRLRFLELRKKIGMVEVKG